MKTDKQLPLCSVSGKLAKQRLEEAAMLHESGMRFKKMSIKFLGKVNKKTQFT